MSKKYTETVDLVTVLSHIVKLSEQGTDYAKSLLIQPDLKALVNTLYHGTTGNSASNDASRTTAVRWAVIKYGLEYVHGLMLGLDPATGELDLTSPREVLGCNNGREIREFLMEIYTTSCLDPGENPRITLVSMLKAYIQANDIEVFNVCQRATVLDENSGCGVCLCPSSIMYVAETKRQINEGDIPHVWGWMDKKFGREYADGFIGGVDNIHVSGYERTRLGLKDGEAVRKKFSELKLI